MNTSTHRGQAPAPAITIVFFCIFIFLCEVYQEIQVIIFARIFGSMASSAGPSHIIDYPITGPFFRTTLPSASEVTITANARFALW